MAGKIRNLLFRDGRYYARRVVPAALRQVLKRSELRKPLGADRRLAIDALPGAMVMLNAELDHGRSVMATHVGFEAASLKSATAPMTDSDLARVHYRERLSVDELLRNSDPLWASIGIDDSYVGQLRDAVAGKLDHTKIDQQASGRPSYRSEGWSLETGRRCGALTVTAVRNC